MSREIAFPVIQEKSSSVSPGIGRHLVIVPEPDIDSTVIIEIAYLYTRAFTGEIQSVLVLRFHQSSGGKRTVLVIDRYKDSASISFLFKISGIVPTFSRFTGYGNHIRIPVTIQVGNDRTTIGNWCQSIIHMCFTSKVSVSVSPIDNLST